MTHLNIDKHPHRRGEYIGHANGPYRIIRGGRGWIAVPCPNAAYQRQFYGRTLREISAQLAAIVR